MGRLRVGTVLRVLAPFLIVAASLVVSERDGTSTGAQVATASATGAATPGVTASVTPGSRGRNIIMLMADDETAADIQFMPNVKALLADQGLTFSNSFGPY